MASVVSLLDNISSRQVWDLIVEQKLAANGYRFYYTIDNHDLHKYCFPGNLTGEEFELNDEGKINYDLETEILTAYEEFFKNITAENPVFLFSEYLPELEGLRYQIIAHATRAMPFNYAKKFLEYLDNFQQENVPEDFTLFIALATGLLKDGIKRFNGMLSNEYFIIKDEIGHSIRHQKIFEALFESDKKSIAEVGDKVFDVFRKRIPLSRRFSKKIDSDVVARLIRMNERLLTEFKDKKILLLYLSSAKSSKEVFREINELLPDYGDEPFNFHRSVEQLFLSRLFQDLTPDLRLERLREVEKLVKYREENQRMADEPDLLKNNMIVSYNELREKYVNINLARKKQFEEIEQLFNELNSIKTDMRLSKVKSLYQKLQKLADRYVDQKLNMEDVRQLESAIEVRQMFTIMFKKAFARLLEGKPIQLRRGSDHIMGVGQHLPIVFTYNDFPGDTQLDEIGELYIEKSFLGNTRVDASVIVQNKLLQLRENNPNKEFFSKSPKENLVYALYLLILPDGAPDHQQDNSHWVEDFLTDIYSKGFEGMDRRLVSDFMYTLAWILRRNEKYEDAKLVTKRGLEMFPRDARFVHSEFLIGACQVSNEGSDGSLRNTYHRFINEIGLIRDLYEPMLESKTEVIRKNIVSTLMNSGIYSSALLLSVSELSLQERLLQLQEIRQQLDYLKRLMQGKYDDYPEFLHTEAFLEMQEAEAAIGNGQKIFKLECAIRSLNKAIEIARLLELYKVHPFEDMLARLHEKLEGYREAGHSETMLSPATV